MGIAELAAKHDKRKLDKNKVTSAIEAQAARMEERKAALKKVKAKDLPMDEHGKERKLEKGEIFSKDAKEGVEYYLQGREGGLCTKTSPCNCLKPALAKVEERAARFGKQTTIVKFWSKDLQDWLTIDGNYIPMGTNKDVLKDCPRPEKRAMSEAQKAALKKGASNLVRKEKAPPPPAKKRDGKRGFQGTLGGSVHILDAGDGSVLATVKKSQSIKDLAKSKKLTLVKRAEASDYAVYVYLEAWTKEHTK